MKNKAELVIELEALTKAYNKLVEGYNTLFVRVVDVAVVMSDKKLGHNAKVDYAKRVFTDYVIKETAKLKEVEKKQTDGKTRREKGG